MATPTKPHDLRVIPLETSPTEDQPSNAPPTNLPVVVGVEVIPYLDMTDGLHGHSRLCLLRSDAEDSDPIYAELSAIIPDADGVEGKALRTSFPIKSPSDPIVEQLLKLKLLELVDPPPSKDYSAVRLTLSDKEVAKRCGDCGRWESRSDKTRLATCSGCRLAWYVNKQCRGQCQVSVAHAFSVLNRFCDGQCQRQAWRDGTPTPHKKLCKRLAAHS